MSDEGGAGAWVAAAIKQLDNPDPAEVAKLERFVDETILGGLQVSEGPYAGGVRKSLFYYDPTAFPRLYDPAVDWKLWSAWDRKEADSLARAYNYPHVAIAHWVLYRLARNSPGLFVAPVGAWITLDAGRIAAAEYDPRTRSIRLTLDVATSDERLARMRIETTTKNGVGYVVAGATPDRGGYQAVLGHAPVVLTLTPVTG